MPRHGWLSLLLIAGLVGMVTGLSQFDCKEIIQFTANSLPSCVVLCLAIAICLPCEQVIKLAAKGAPVAMGMEPVHRRSARRKLTPNSVFLPTIVEA